MKQPERYVEPRLTQYLFDRASRTLTPLSGTFELSPVCNLACKMCYVRKTPAEVAASPRPPVGLIQWLSIAEQAREAMRLDAVIFVPTGIPVFKRDRPVSAAADRLAMCRLAVESNPFFDVSDIEIRRGGDTYTVDTLRQMRAHYPVNVELWFITGADAIASIVKWRESAAIADLAKLIAVTRPGFPLTEQRRREIETAGNFDVRYMEATALSVSSSDLRRRVAEGKSIRYLTMARVREYIDERRLYRNGALEDVRDGGCVADGM